MKYIFSNYNKNYVNIMFEKKLTLIIRACIIIFLLLVIYNGYNSYNSHNNDSYTYKTKNISYKTKSLDVSSANNDVEMSDYPQIVTAFQQLDQIKNYANKSSLLTLKNLEIDSSNLKYFNTGINETSSSQTVKNDDKIFVSIASYRDEQCSLTLSNIIKMAHNPEKLVIVICEQNDENDDECMKTNYIKGVNIKRIRMDYTEAMGPCWARYLIQNMWEGEQYYLQIDSHTRFVEGWDTICKRDLKSAQKKNNYHVCLSNYVSTYNIKTEEIEINPMRGPLYIESLETDGFFRFNSKYCNNLKTVKESKGWSGCFSFSSSNIILDAPYDPHTPFLFFGEETDIFARLYTRGWKIFVPKEPVCFTVFDRSYRKTFWEHKDQKITSELSKMRLYLRFGILNEDIVNKIPYDIRQNMSIYSLGNKKTFNQFVNYCYQ